MVLVHEFGHFLTAKLCGVRVEAFSIGMGPRVFGVRYGDTDYRLSLLPLGGYVKMAGEYSADAVPTAPDDFTAQPRWQRVLIALSGPFSNFLLSFFLLFLVAHFHHEVDQYLNGPAVVDYVPANTPAAADGLAAGDTIVSLNGVDHPTWTRVLEEFALNQNRTLPLTFDHNGQQLTRSLRVQTDGSGEFSPDDVTSMGLLPRVQNGPVGVLAVQSGSPAERAGLQPGDQVVSIDGLAPHSVPTLLAYLKDRNGAPSTLDVLRHGQPVTLSATPERVDSPGSTPHFQLGFQAVQPPVEVERLPFGAAIRQSLKENGKDSTLILRVLKGMFTRHVAVKSLMGPVGIAQQIDLATRLGFWTLLTLMSTISLNLGIFNLLPFPPLDGGMILFLLIESVIRRDVKPEVKERIYQVAIICVIVFAVFVLFNDITRLHLGKP